MPLKHNTMISKRGRKHLYAALAIFSLALTGLFIAPVFFPTVYKSSKEDTGASAGDVSHEIKTKPVATHLPTPEPVRALYMTSCVAGMPSLRARLVSIAEETEINSLVIDIKDYSGNIAFRTDNELLKDAVGITCRVADTREFIASLHEKNIYVIGRITVFQDPFFAKKRPDLAVQKESDKTVWKDYKGISFIDAGAREYWEYIVALSHESYNIGFDELNFDYIRFPSDGNMRDIYYPWSEGQILADPYFGKAHVLKEFFSYLHDALAETDAVLSADLFGMVTTNTDDLNVGQVLEYTLPYFDYIAPMVYPSHYPKGFNGWQNPNFNVYGVVRFSMDSAVRRTTATTTAIAAFGNELIATTTPLLYSKQAFDASKLRPWLQDFDYPVLYTPEMVKAQIRAVYDAGIDSWMLWDPSNQYTREVLLDKDASRQLTE